MEAWKYRTIPFEERVLSRLRPDGSGCLIYTGRLNSDGYGQPKDHGRGVLLHRWMWERHNGRPIPPGMCVMHSCDTPACVNPAHLSLGTHTDNMRDKAAKGRSKNVPRGFAHKRPHAKITEETARAIKNQLHEGCRQADLMRFYGVSRNLISEIALGKTWAHI